DLAAVVDFMFDHRAQPLADTQLRATRSEALLVQIGVAERSKNLHRLFMHAAEIGERCIVSVRELAPVSGIATRPQLRVLGKHPPLGRAEMAKDIAERVLAWLVRPFDLLGRDARGDAHRALAD